MAKTTTNKIDQERLCEDSEHLRDVLKIIMNGEDFRKLFVEKVLQKSTCRRLSRGMKRHLQTILKCDLAQLTYEKVTESMACFLVEKKKGNVGRFICNCRPLNERQARPGPMELPMINFVISEVLKWNYASQCDGKAYFCQFELCEEIRKSFTCRLADFRGEIVNILLKRLPMGWAHAPRIAQAVRNFVMDHIGIGWVDNFLFGGATQEEFESKRSLLRERLIRYNIEVDDMEMEACRNLKALGIEFDLVKHRYRLDEDWIASRKPLFDFINQNDSCTYREVFVVLGSLFWTSYVADDPLWNHAETLAMISQLAKEVTSWEGKTSIPNYAKSDLKNWTSKVLQNEWMTVKQSPCQTGTEGLRTQCAPTEDTLSESCRQPPPARSSSTRCLSDASDNHAAWVRIMDDAIIAGEQWRRDPKENIFLGELDALIHAVQAYPDDDQTVDNLGLHMAVRKGHSSSYEANVRMRSSFGQKKPHTDWIRTHRMLADPFSRNFDLPSFPNSIWNWVTNKPYPETISDGNGDTGALSSNKNRWDPLETSVH